MIILEHNVPDAEHTHEFPDDWVFGGANGLDPRADPRWQQSTYIYYNERAEEVMVTQVPLCDDAALDYCTKVASWGPTMNPHWVAVKRPDGSMEMLPWTYDKKTDTLTPKE